MSDDEADPELLALLRQHLEGKPNISEEPETGVLEGVEYVYDNSIDVAVDMRATKNAAATIYEQMQQKGFSTANWADQEMHPKTKDESTVAFIFTMDLLNFSFWSLLPEDERYAVLYRDKRWTGYGSLVASLQRALEEEAADGSAAGLVNLLAQDFACFRDEFPFPGRRRPVRFLKRAQILVADLWACFGGESYGEFYDIDKVTMFADYRIPQILVSLSCLGYSPPLQAMIERKEVIESGSGYEMQIRAGTIWCVELIRREIKRQHPEAKLNAILIDFFLYDTMKQLEAQGKETIPHHRTRSIWY
ncbi:hypothetical protein DL766_003161 [Monosporascus sp. MC13-8B]|uniref:Queuosine 5'-phosphate N-glycosylase/hydrolase n=1 Tax=Monosporascus cannonballus TaxID=155416 RepID=A0ABY0GWA3_9PEZI|nr:hypothetical protein DL762_008510 [Monosporascus cannonballus]RYP34068.1 hypothetical protein DL766_003161 [Monosporascus sp. MC13-8B]